MASASRLIDETLGMLQSFAQGSEQVTTLASTITSTALGFTVTAAQNGIMGLSPGIVEMGSELLYCDAVADDGTATVAPWGRGYSNSRAVTHAAGIKVTSQPIFPRFWVLETMNEVIQRVYPRIFVAATQTFTTTLPVTTYDLPDEAERVLDAKWQPPNGTDYWESVRRWRVNNGGSSASSDLGVSVDIADDIMPGRPLIITYASPPNPFTAETDDFTDVTGLGEGMRDVIVTGTAAKLARAQELVRLQTFSVEQQDRNRDVAPSAALTASRFLEQDYQTRLKEEIAALRTKWPVRVSRSWV